MAKEITGYVKLQIKGGQANPAPPVGPALGQRGINIMEFCKSFNEKTKSFMGKPIPVVITVYKDKKFDFVIKSPPASHFIKEAAKIERWFTRTRKGNCWFYYHATSRKNCKRENERFKCFRFKRSNENNLWISKIYGYRSKRIKNNEKKVKKI